VSFRLAFGCKDSEAAFWSHMAGQVVQITAPDDGPCADYVLTGTWQWNDLLCTSEIGVRAWSAVTDEAMGETFTMALSGEERVFVYGISAPIDSSVGARDPITLVRRGRRKPAVETLH